jgi:hypothetical protein
VAESEMLFMAAATYLFFVGVVEVLENSYSAMRHVEQSTTGNRYEYTSDPCPGTVIDLLPSAVCAEEGESVIFSVTL